MREEDLRQPFALESFLNSSAQPSEIVAARAATRLEDYRPNPTTGKQAQGTTLSFGLPNLDEMVVMLRGCYYLVAARPRTGKSAFAMQVVDTALRQLQGTGKTVVIFSAEMDAETLALREACAAENFSYWNMVRGKLPQSAYDSIKARALDNGKKGYYLDESNSPTVEHMVAQLTAISKGTEAGIGLVLFDYLQLGGELDRDEVRRINKISRGMKGIAKRFSCPVLALSQLNREIEKRKEGQAQLSDLAYGGEQDPDAIIVLHRPWLQDSLKPRELVEVWIPKHRHGPGGFCFLAFDEETMRFRQAIMRKVELNEERPKTPDREVPGTVEGGRGAAPSSRVPVRPPTEVASGLHQYRLDDDDRTGGRHME